MSYTKPTQTTFAANLQPNEFVVTLDTGETVAVCAMAHRIAGNRITVDAAARQVGPDGSTIVDANGHAVTSSLSHAFTGEDVTAYTAPTLIKDCMLLVLGEPTLVFGATLGLPPLDPTAVLSYSIRHAIANAAHAGPVTNAASLL